MRIDLPAACLPAGLSVRLRTVPGGTRAGALHGLLAAVVFLSGCGMAGTRPADSAAKPAVEDPKAVAAALGPHVLVPGEGNDGKDLVVPLPPWPQDKDLVALRQERRPDLRFAVDQQSLQLVPGGEVRYTFVARSASGARSVTFEAIRCGSRERMMLATGTADGRWSPVRTPRWDPVDRNDPAGMRAVLHKDIFCPGRVAASSLNELRSALKAGLHPRAVLD